MTAPGPSPTGSEDGPGWTDLARNAPGIGLSYEAARRRQAEGLGADRSWRVGRDGEAAVGELLAELTTPTRWERLRRRPPGWHVLHSVEFVDEHGRTRGDVDHVLIGPPGAVTINTKHHRAAQLTLDGDELLRGRHREPYVPKARREAQRVAEHLRPALRAAGHPELAERLTSRPLLAIVGARLVVRQWPAGVTVVMSEKLLHALRSIPAALDPGEVGAVYEIARRSTTWRRPTRSRVRVTSAISVQLVPAAVVRVVVGHGPVTGSPRPARTRAAR